MSETLLGGKPLRIRWNGLKNSYLKVIHPSYSTLHAYIKQGWPIQPFGVVAAWWQKWGVQTGVPNAS